LATESIFVSEMYYLSWSS